MKRLCKCGAIVDGICPKCYKPQRRESTAKRGYDHIWRRLSERVRKEQPLCPDCEAEGFARATTEVHHIIPIAKAPSLRLVRNNLIALCTKHHALREAE